MAKIIIHIKDGQVYAVHATTDLYYVVVQQEGNDIQTGLPNEPDSVHERMDLTNPTQYCDL